MTKPEGLKPKTSRDHDYLVGCGWRYIGARRAKYGTHYYWDHQDSDGAWSKQYIQGDAVAFQKRLERKARAGLDTARCVVILLLLAAVTAQAATVTLNVSCFAGLVHDAGTSDCSAGDTAGASASGSASASALTLGAWQASVGITAHMGQSWAGGAGAAAITAHFGTVGEIRQGWFALTTDIQGSADIDSHYQGDVYVADRHFQYTGGGFGPSGGIPLHWQQFPLTLGVLNPFALNVSAMASPGPYLHPTASTTFTVGLRVYEADGVTPVAFNASPEPGTWILIGVGLLGLIVKGKRVSEIWRNTMCDMPMEKNDVTCPYCWWRGKRHPYWRERVPVRGCPRCQRPVSDGWIFKTVEPLSEGEAF